MGQPVSVVRKPASQPDVVRLETNRTLTGMGHEHYSSTSDVDGDRPPDELARRLFAHGGVRSVHVFSNVITIELEPGAKSEGLEDVVRELYIHYKPGVAPSFTA